jgi:hypothetical protein
MTSFSNKDQQRGAALLIFFVILFTTAATVLLRAVNNIDFSTRTTVTEQQEMAQAKDALLAFALTSADNYAGQSPGRLPCPDTNNDGLANAPCANNIRGRLPTHVQLPSGSPFPLSNYGQNSDQRFWYVVNPLYSQDPGGILNSSVAGTLSLDGQPDIVAMLIAPSDSLTGQVRTSPANQLAANNYLEAGNVSGTALVSSLGANPTAFNDRLVPIYRHELMTLATTKVAQEIVNIVRLYRAANPAYPATSAEFDVAVTNHAAAWFNSNLWRGVTIISLISATGISFNFTDCDVSYTITYSTLAITRTPYSCEN